LRHLHQHAERAIIVQGAASLDTDKELWARLTACTWCPVLRAQPSPGMRV
jgi:hypothetical protein